MIAPLIDELSKEYKGRIRVVKLNTDESPAIATEYGIRSIPTVMIFKASRSCLCGANGGPGPTAAHPPDPGRSRTLTRLLSLQGGKKMDTVIGAVAKSTLTQTLEKYL